jgi:hypothetical protein
MAVEEVNTEMIAIKHDRTVVQGPLTMNASQVLMVALQSLRDDRTII